MTSTTTPTPKGQPRRYTTRAYRLRFAALKAQGLSINEIARRTGFHRKTVAKHLAPEPAPGRWPTLQPCGTNAAYSRHLRNGEQPCPACCGAHADDVRVAQRASRERKKAALEKQERDNAKRRERAARQRAREKAAREAAS